MKYLFLALAAVFEIGWPLGFKLSESVPVHRTWWLLFSALCMALSGLFLYEAQKTMPVSTAYIIWTGAGALGTFIMGATFFGDSASLQRMLFALLILVGIVGMELSK